MIHRIKTKIEIIWRFLPVIWSLTWYDYSSLLTLQIAQLKYMEDHWLEGNTIKLEKTKRDITTARILSERLLNDEYDDAPWRKRTIKASSRGDWPLEDFEVNSTGYDERQSKQDLEMLYCKLFRRKMKCWWD